MHCDVTHESSSYFTTKEIVSGWRCVYVTKQQICDWSKDIFNHIVKCDDLMS